MNLKKISRKFALFLLTSGASMILGLLSFGGMFALWPILPLAFATFVLSTGYEWEIYSQNIKGAWNKLFKHNSLKRQLAKDFLLDNFPTTLEDDCPQFFKDYAIQLQLLHTFGRKSLNKESRAQKKLEEKRLRDMEKWFALQLFDDTEADRPLAYESKLREWFNDESRQAKREETRRLHDERQNSFWWAQHFSTVAGVFMGLGSTYLLVETFTIIPLFATLPLTAWPFLILPMATIAGAAYGLLTYNAVTDFLVDDTFWEWCKDLGIIAQPANDAEHDEHEHHEHAHHEHAHGGHAHGNPNGSAPFLKPLLGWVLVTLAIGLTVCTAGTWWSVVKETRPLFTWMANLPRFIMGLINPTITAFSAVVFNLQNTRESLGVLLEVIATFGEKVAYAKDQVTNGYGRLRKHENLAQIINPGRLVLIATIMPLRVLLFLGHLVSIGVTADRLPGVSQLYSAILGFISEFFEDLHYFFGHEHVESEQPTLNDLLQQRLGKGHRHNHDLDLPTTALKWILTPVYYMAMWWDWGFSQWNTGTRGNETPYSLSYDGAKEKNGFDVEKDIRLAENAAHPSKEWALIHTIHRIKRYLEKRSVDASERGELSSLQQALRTVDADAPAIKTAVDEVKTKPGQHHQQRFFKSETYTFLHEELPNRVGFGAARG